MAYLHCHTKGCNWSQDDFYSKLYNPLTKIWSDIKWLWKPKMIDFDFMFVETDYVDLKKFTKISVKFFKREKQIISGRIKQMDCEGNEIKLKTIYICFSWNWLLLEIVKDIRVGLQMRWWTYKSFKNAFHKGKAKCPECGLVNFDID